ncbi:S-adenosyl methyltransferase [Thermomonospora umbrina]|uniref:S-adenosyl methyltransferase n=1 Tax=Thermomonospora umbrina TaxID=111806 RepID=A0A3D9SXD4_9ACTN|nr:S-adenosyl methyltransferase [Thermomonospora umbrina]
MLTWQPPPPVAADARVLASGGDPTVPAHSGMMDYLLGGDFNTAADRAAVEKIRAVAPDIGEVVAENLAFYSRALRTVFKAGIEQVVELGIGMPCGDAAHHLARRVSPGTKVLYVSGDKPVATHAKSHLTGEATGIFYNDIREPHRIPEHPEARRLIDWDRPVAIVVRDVLNYLQCEDNPQYLLARLMKSASSGSYLIASNTTSESISDLLYEQLAHSFSNAGQKLVFRSQAEMESLFAGLTLLDPGVVGVHEWRPEKPTKPLPMQFLGGMAIKP